MERTSFIDGIKQRLRDVKEYQETYIPVPFDAEKNGSEARLHIFQGDEEKAMPRSSHKENKERVQSL
jgi:hypothetical protein